MNIEDICALIFFFVTISLIVGWLIYEQYYYNSEEFLSLKRKIQSYVNDCNELNNHIKRLRNTYIGINQLDYGSVQYYDRSQWGYKRPELKNQQYAPNIHNCSRTVCENARRQPFKYICKYFNLKPTEETLEKIEKVLNNFEAAEQGKKSVQAQKRMILNSIEKDVPFLIQMIDKKTLERKLGFQEINLNTPYFPEFIFKYISSGGYASTQCNMVMNIENLNRFITYLSEVVKFKNSAAGQRALMTSSLRQKIMRRDNYTCLICGASMHNEPNLLLEIDHIIPVSKGGLTTESNLRTLCWRCNRRKGAKIETPSNTISNPVAQPTIEKKEEPKDIYWCTCCNSQNPTGANYCVSCGMRLTPYN